jgi:MarR family transcriptional regulator, negative regulator of the multidrug operon emrRAB
VHTLVATGAAHSLPSAMGEEERRANMLGAFALAVADRLRSETEAAVGHGGAAAAALVTIVQFPDRTVEFLRQAVGLSHPAAVRVVDRLVEDRLVRRRPVGRGPAVALTATAAGARAARRVLDARRAVLAGALPELSEAEAAALSAILERALESLADTPATTICRLCDMRRCRRIDCPVVDAQVALGVPPPAFVPVDDGLA